MRDLGKLRTIFHKLAPNMRRNLRRRWYIARLLKLRFPSGFFQKNIPGTSLRRSSRAWQIFPPRCHAARCHAALCHAARPSATVPYTYRYKSHARPVGTRNRRSQIIRFHINITKVLPAPSSHAPTNDPPLPLPRRMATDKANCIRESPSSDGTNP
jgi:hypothetical protein